jgi:SPP1 family predicted phage head-tail adaptor
MNIGSLRHRITIQHFNKSDNPFALPDGWTNVATVWADIKPLTSKEVYQVGELAMKVSHKVTIRYPGKNKTIIAGDRILYGSRVFELQTGIMNPDERNISLELLAFEIDPAL